MNTISEENNEFALAMYERLRQQPRNLSCCPFSIRIVLGMAQAGARIETAAQIRKALCITSPDETLHADFGRLVERLNEAAGQECELAITNSLWGQEGAPLESDFLGLIARHYGGAMFPADFKRAAEAARVRMNRWVEDGTRQRIRELIPAGSVNSETRLVAMNAVFFKGKWTQPFRRAATRNEPFALERGGEVQVPLMRQEEEIPYLQADGFQAVDLAYRGADLSMLVLLPNRKDGPTKPSSRRPKKERRRQPSRHRIFSEWGRP